ncbi:MAG: HAD family hydrolase [Planctomycetes bacterium]|nr:HAD family hydrolase [Planctomycetota bacterium]
MPDNKPLRIAMWSGPRNISTALMRSWENRLDTLVRDEPFYAYYLALTGAPHPLAAEIIAQGPTDWRAVVEEMCHAPLGGHAIHYQKQMTHHLLPEVDRNWLAALTNCFLIRHPAEVIASYLKKNYRPTAEDLGFPQQLDIFATVERLTGTTPLVIDAADVLHDPHAMLTTLCERLGVEFSEAMIAWPAGYRSSDGIWAPHWYGEVVRTTGFAPYRPQPREVPDDLREVHTESLACYERLYAVRLLPSSAARHAKSPSLSR